MTSEKHHDEPQSFPLPSGVDIRGMGEFIPPWDYRSGPNRQYRHQIIASDNVPRGTYVLGDFSWQLDQGLKDIIAKLDVDRKDAAERSEQAYAADLAAGKLQHRQHDLPFDQVKYERLLFPGERIYWSHKLTIGERVMQGIQAGLRGTLEAAIAEYGLVYRDVRKYVPAGSLECVVRNGTWRCYQAYNSSDYLQAHCLHLALEDWLAVGVDEYRVAHGQQYVMVTVPLLDWNYHARRFPGRNQLPAAPADDGPQDAYSFYDEQTAVTPRMWRYLLRKGS